MINCKNILEKQKAAWSVDIDKRMPLLLCAQHVRSSTMTGSVVKTNTLFAAKQEKQKQTDTNGDTVY